MRNYIYDVFLCADKNEVDMTVAIAMFDADARNQTAGYLHEDTDSAALHHDFMVRLVDDENHDKAFSDTMAFIRKHYKSLCECFRLRDREKFAALVAELSKEV